MEYFLNQVVFISDMFKGFLSPDDGIRLQIPKRRDLLVHKNYGKRPQQYC